MKYTDVNFLNEANKIHNNKYKYNLIENFNSTTKIEIICPIHGIFYQRSSSHLYGVGCKKCASNNMKNNYDNILEKLNFINKTKHNNKFDYSLFVEYIGMKNKIKIICKKCNIIFEQRLSHHLNGIGCSNCLKYQYTVNEYLKKVNIKYNNKFKYIINDIDFNNNSYIEIICNKHGSFFEKANDHLNKHKSCKKCIEEKIITNEIFLKKANLLHNNEFEYLTEYINMKTYVKIKCKKCQSIFKQIPDNHLSKKHGCSNCNTSKGEKIISKILTDLQIEYIKEYKMYKKNKKHPYRFDFFIPKYNLFIE
jgi:hypothetical protein